jgi:hypothetical protein
MVVAIAKADIAVACGNGKLIFQDRFETLDPAWQFDGSVTSAKVGAGGLVAEVPPGKTLSAIHLPGRYQNFEICASFETDSAKEAGDFVALRFWTTDGNDEYWAVTFTGKGWYVVNHYAPGQDPRSLTSQVDDPSLLKAGENEVSVSLEGNKGDFFVNGKHVAAFAGMPPGGGSVFGFALYSGKTNTEPSTIILKSIELREPAGP